MKIAAVFILLISCFLIISLMPLVNSSSSLQRNCPAYSVSSSCCTYAVNKMIVNTTLEYRFYCDSHHFMTLVDEAGTFNLRPHPGADPNGWGSSWYAQPFLPGAHLNHTVIEQITADHKGIHIVVNGSVSRGAFSTFGKWKSNLDINYSKMQKKIEGTGNYAITLPSPLDELTGDLNLYKIASSYLDNVPLLSGGVGDTGDMTKAIAKGDTFAYTWTPPTIPEYFPQDYTDFLTVDVEGDYNEVDTAAQGYDPIAAAYKPGINITLTAMQTNIFMIFGAIYNTSLSQQFWEDNVGITPLILHKSTLTQYNFTVKFSSTTPEPSLID